MNTLPLNHHIALSDALVPALRWDGVTPIKEHRAACTKRLIKLLGLDTFAPCEPVFEITAEDELHGCRHIHFTLQTEQGYFTHCDLLLPKEQKGKLPLCATLQGHSKGAHISLGTPKYPGDEELISSGDRDFCVRAVAEGFAALAIEQRGFGQCGGTVHGPACERPAMTALLLGRTLIGERVWDVMRVLDAIETHFADLITMQGSVLMGNSGGGTSSYYAACMDERIKVSMPSSSFCSVTDAWGGIRHCG